MTFEEYREIAKKYEKLVTGHFDDERMQEIKNILLFNDFYKALVRKSIHEKKCLADNVETTCRPLREPNLEEYDEFLKFLDLSKFSDFLNANNFNWYDLFQK